MKIINLSTDQNFFGDKKNVLKSDQIDEKTPGIEKREIFKSESQQSEVVFEER